MKKRAFLVRIFLLILILHNSTIFVFGQKKPDEGFLGKADLYKAKKTALEYLSDNSTIEKYGKISDSIWHFAELGMQEFRSSAILIRSLEEEGFTIMKGVAGMPTCFVATWGSGKPVIGILGEFDALPMISQKALTPKQSSLIEGAPGHGCGHNLMGTAGIAACNMLREHLFYTHRLHYVITEGGEAPNVVPDKASVWYYVRNTDERLEDMYKRVIDCALGAALATGTKLDTVRVITGVHQKHSNKGLAETIQRNIELVGLPEWSESEQDFSKALQKELGEKETGYPSKINSLRQPPELQVGGGSSDVGEVTMITPTATLNFPGGVPGSIGHHWSSVASYYGTAAWKGLNAGAKVMAGTALDLFTKPKLLEDIKNEFAIYSKDNPYKSFLPEGAKPPLDLNKELMGKFRDAMYEIENVK